jgi:hypothetical protein
LVELLITMTLAVVLLLATFAAADALMRGNAKIDRKTDAQQEARRAVSTLVDQLRDARPAPGDTTPLAVQAMPTRSSIVFASRLTRDQGPTAQPGWIRVCATSTTAPAQVLVGTRTAAAYADPGVCAPTTTTNGWSYGPLMARNITNPGQLFNFSSGSCVGATCTPTTAALVRAITTVGVSLQIDAGRDDPAFVAGDAVAIRNRRN